MERPRIREVVQYCPKCKRRGLGNVRATSLIMVGNRTQLVCRNHAEGQTPYPGQVPVVRREVYRG